MRLRPLLLTLPLLASTGVVVTSMGASAPAQATPVLSGVTRVSDLLVDEAHGHVFVAPGGQGGGLRVADLDGEIVTTLTDVSGATSLLLSDDGSEIYATGATSISVIDAVTLAVDPVAMPEGVCPKSLAETSGLVFFGYTTSCGSSGVSTGNIGSLDGSQQLTLNLAPGSVAAPRLLASPARPDVLFAVDRDGAMLRSYDVLTSPALSLPLRDAISSEWGDITDEAIDPDGSRLLIATTGPSLKPYAAEDLSPLALLPWPVGYDEPTAVAVRADGVAASNGYTGRPPITYRADGTLWRTYTAPRGIVSQGLAFGAQDLYYVRKLDGELRLGALTPRGSAELKLKTDRNKYDYGAVATVTARISTTGENRSVEIYATPHEGSSILIGAGEVDAGGYLTATTKLQKNTTFNAVFSGDETTDPAATQLKVGVRARVSMSLRGQDGYDGRWALYREGGKVVTPVKVAPDHSGRCLYMYAQRWWNGQWGSFSSIPCARLDSDSRTSAYLVTDGMRGYRLRFTGIWNDGHGNIRTVGNWVYVRVVR